MRIGIDGRLWNESGVGRYIRNLVYYLHKLDKRNEYVLFVLSKDTKRILNQVQNDNFRIVRADIRWHTLEEQLRFPAILNQDNLDLVHFPYFSVPVFYNRPFIVTIHDLILHHFPTGEASTLPWPMYQIKLLGYKFVIAHAAKRAEKVIAVSNATKKEIIDHLGVSSDKVEVTYEGVDEQIRNSKWERFASEIRNKFKIQNNKHFLYVGNAYPHKNLERLLEAFSIVCHPELVSGSKDSDLRQNDIQLVLVGKEDYFYKRLREKVKRMNMTKHVVFYGEANDEELMSLYRNAKALVLPSLMEGFGLSALEAMANNCLVLSSDIPALREVCKDSAIYFNPRSEDEIAKTMEAVHSNDTYYYSDNIKRGIERAKMFSWQKMARQTLKIYESCISV